MVHTLTCELRCDSNRGHPILVKTNSRQLQPAMLMLSGKRVLLKRGTVLNTGVRIPALRLESRDRRRLMLTVDAQQRAAKMFQRLVTAPETIFA